MAKVPDELKYTKEHEWIRLDGETGIEGITDYAQSELSDIVMVEPPKAGTKFAAGDAIGTIEAVKAVSDFYASVSGEVVEVNEKVVNDPSLINKDPYGEGWIIKIKLKDKAEYDRLLTAEQYKTLIASH